MKIAVFLPNWIGDVVMATPALRALRDRFTDAEIVGVMRPYVADVLDGTTLLDRNLLDHSAITKTWRSRWDFVRQLRRERFDLGLLLPNSFHGALLARLGGMRRRIGYARDGRGLLLTDSIPAQPRKRPRPALDDYLRLVGELDCETASRTMELAVTAADESVWQQYIKDHGGPAWSGGHICVNPGGAFGSAKHWPTSSFAELSRRMALEFGVPVLVLCGPNERNEARAIAEQAHHPAVMAADDGPATIGFSKAAIRASRLLVTTDSGPRHFAAPFGVPVVTLFGPTHIAWSETHYAKAVHLQLDVDCGPCQQRVCPLGHHRCMRDLRVRQVFQAVCEQWRQADPSRVAA